MLFGDTDIETAVREPLGELVQPGPPRHGGGDGDDALIGLRLLDQRLREDIGVAGRVRLRLHLRTGHQIELLDRVIFLRAVLGERMPPALLGHDVQQHRPSLRPVAQAFQNRHKMADIVPVDRTDIQEAQLLEQRTAGDHATGIFLGPPRRILQRLGETAGHLLHRLAQPAIGFRRDQAREIIAHRAGRRGDRHVIVVQDDDQPAVHRTGIVHRLIGHAGAHRAVADDGDDVVVAALQVTRHRHAEAGGDRGRAVRRAERIVVAFRPPGETAEAAALAQRADAVAPPGQDLVRIGLMANIPDQPVARRIEDMMDRHRQLDHAEAGAQMTAGARHRVDGLAAQIVGQHRQLVDREILHVRRCRDRIENRGWVIGHGPCLTHPLHRGGDNGVVPPATSFIYQA